MERKLRVLLNFQGLKPGTELTEEEVKKYFNINYALECGWITEVKCLEFENPNRPGDGVERLYDGDLVFFVKMGNPLVSGSFELTDELIEYYSKPRPAGEPDVRLFYDEKDRDEFVQKTLSEITKYVGGCKCSDEQASLLKEKLFSFDDIQNFIKEADTYNGSPFAKRLEKDIIENALVHLI